MEEARNAYRIWVEKALENIHLEDQERDGRILSLIVRIGSR